MMRSDLVQYSTVKKKSYLIFCFIFNDFVNSLIHELNVPLTDS